METRTVFFIGKPGCGKGTQAKLLSERTGWPIFSAGKEFRKIAEETTLVGKKIKQEIDAGLLAPPWFAMYLYQKALFSVNEGQGIIFDGFNRKAQEAELIRESLLWLNRSFVVFNIIISDEEAAKRVSLRKLASDRVDEDFVPERLKEYNKFTKDAIELFRQSGKLIDIHGEQTPDEVAADIQKALNL